jgi:protein O-mannosyl-transferase
MNNPNPVTAILSKKTFWILAIALITLIVYFPGFGNLITNWDDSMYITDNPYIKSLSWKNIVGMFTVPFMGNYHPLTMLSLAIDYQVGKFNPFIYEFTNVLLHSANAVLVFLLIRLLVEKPREIAIIAGLLFGVHTLHVESVTWISERKDVLYSFFFLLSLYSYVKYTFKKEHKWYIWSIILFVLSLLSKGQAVSLAFTLMLIDFIRGRKVFSMRILFEKLPFFLLALVFGIIAIKAQTGAEATNMEAFTMQQRIAFAAYGLMMYFFKLLVPLGLSSFYPYPIIIKGGDIPPVYWISMIIYIALAILLFLSYKRSKTVFFGVSFFLVNIFLVLQLLPVGSAIMADRYAYIPSIGYCYLFGYFVTQKKYLRANQAGYIIAAIYIIFLSFLTLQRTTVWKDSITLWTDVIGKNKNVVIAWYNRGNIKSDSSDFKGAVADYNEAVLVDPNYINAYINRGTAKSKLNDYIGAVEDFTIALRKDSSLASGYIDRAAARRSLKDYQGALADYDKALIMKPKQPELYLSRGTVKADLQNYQGAISDFTYAIQLNPGYIVAYTNRSLIKKTINDMKGALEDYDKAIEVEPNNSELYNNRGNIKYQMGDKKAAIEDYTYSLKLNPKDYLTYKNRGSIYLLMKNYPEALADLSMAIKMNPDNGELYYNRALVEKEMKNLTAMQEDYDHAIKLDPNFAGEGYRQPLGVKANINSQQQNVLIYKQATIFEAQGNYQAAIENYKKVLISEPNYPEAWFNLGNTYGKLGRFDEALTCFNNALTYKKDYFEALSSRGIAKASLGKIPEAISDLTAAINAKPDMGVAYFNRAMVYLNSGKREMACPDLQKAVQLGYSDAYSIYQKECKK